MLARASSTHCPATHRRRESCKGHLAKVILVSFVLLLIKLREIRTLGEEGGEHELLRVARLRSLHKHVRREEFRERSVWPPLHPPLEQELLNILAAMVSGK